MAFLSSLAFSFMLSAYFALRVGCNQVPKHSRCCCDAVGADQCCPSVHRAQLLRVLRGPPSDAEHHQVRVLIAAVPRPPGRHAMVRHSASMLGRHVAHTLQRCSCFYAVLCCAMLGRHARPYAAALQLLPCGAVLCHAVLPPPALLTVGLQGMCEARVTGVATPPPSAEAASCPVTQPLSSVQQSQQPVPHGRAP